MAIAQITNKKELTKIPVEQLVEHILNLRENIEYQDWHLKDYYYITTLAEKEIDNLKLGIAAMDSIQRLSYASNDFVKTVEKKVLKIIQNEIKNNHKDINMYEKERKDHKGKKK